jgi:hypothetical protein
MVIENLKQVVGMATGNAHIGAASMHACHILHACMITSNPQMQSSLIISGGNYLTNRQEQEKAVEFLLEVDRKCTWRTSAIITRLREQWAEV